MKTLFSVLVLVFAGILLSFTSEKPVAAKKMSCAYAQTDTIPRNKKDTGRYPRDTMRIPRDTINRDTNAMVLYK